jgi:DNA-binding MarR family transcriptional regulator
MTRTKTTTPSPRAAGPRVSYLIGRLHRVLRARLDASIRTHGLTVAQYAALSILGDQPGLSNAQLARRSFMSAQSAHETMKALQTAGLIRRAAAPEHGRISVTELTSRGRKVLAACNALVDVTEAEMLRAVPRDDRDSLLVALKACLAKLDSSYRG